MPCKLKLYSPALLEYYVICYAWLSLIYTDSHMGICPQLATINKKKSLCG